MQTGCRLAAPALAESEQAVEPVRAIEMHAVAISEVERNEPANRFAAARALPIRRALPVLHMPVIFDFAPSEPRCFVGGVKGAPIRQRLTISGAPFDCRSGVGPIRCRLGHQVLRCCTVVPGV